MNSPIIRELFSSLDLPPTAAGQLDWVTGTYRINLTVGEWEAYFANPANDPEMTVTLVHEMHHFLQISSLSYLHRFASLLYYSIAEAVKDCYNDMSALPATLDANDAVRDAVWDLQWREPDGVSVLDIIESLTYFIEINTEKPIATSAYVALLNDADDLPDEYTRAFRNLYELSARNGDTAALFEILCHMSLCSATPRECFAMLGERVRSGEVNVNMTFDQMVTFCEKNDPHHWGFAWDWRQQLGADFPQHPIFGSLETAIREETLWQNFIKYLLSPHQFLDPFLRLAQGPPILFNPYPDGTAPGFNEWPLDVGLALRNATAEEKRKRGMWFLYMASASRKYLGAFGTPPATVRPVI
jgi:hypothetical protein